MKKIILGAVTAVIFSAAMGAASAYEYSTTAKKAAKTEGCACKDCACTDCNCTDCANGACDKGCCDGATACNAK